MEDFRVTMARQGAYQQYYALITGQEISRDLEKRLEMALNTGLPKSWLFGILCAVENGVDHGTVSAEDIDGEILHRARQAWKQAKQEGAMQNGETGRQTVIAG